MSALSPRSESSSRNWWPLSSNKASSSPAPTFSTSSSKKNDPNKFNSLASAIGFKAKKHPHPSLAIQDPPPLSPVYSPPPPSPNRPPSKSVSSVRSQADSMPGTPLDSSSPNHRNSLLTLSDVDPFASRGIAIPIDPNRLSVYSGNSFSPEFVAKDAPVLHRVSYASSSSHSNYEIASPASSIYESPGRKKLSQKKSLGDIGSRNGYPSGMIKSNSSVTLTDKNRLSHPEIALTARPPMRARGLTDAAATIYHRPNFLQDAHPAPVSPRVIIRQPSVQRKGLPVSAPPRQQLPPPPPPTEDDSFDSLRFSTTSASSSTSSFRSIRDASMASQHYIPRSKLIAKETESISKARTLKKAVSHQSLSKTASSSTTSIVTPPPEPIDRAPRKQRSFHHPRIPLPPIPLSLKHQSTGSTVTSSDGMESKRASANGPPTPSRKRLFSNSSIRRPSTSQDTLADDDHRSVFSLDREKPHGLLTRNLTSKSSFWDETSGDTAPSSPHALTVDYTPQQIMSPAEMLKLEADVQESRSRAMSITSSATFASVDPEQVSTMHTLASSVRSHGLLNPQPPPIRSNSMGSGSVIVSPRLPRPSTAQSSSSPSILSNISSPPGFVSLPPPPRSRRSQPTFTPSNEVPLIKPLSPPPRTRIVSKKASAEKVNTRLTSLMRKPSFLDIDDDLVEKSPPPVPALTREASFLDLARESFDTVRSDTEDEEQRF
ncbi:hypothetical protein BDP27DRAFT_1313808 [Rhodocollybia butyracea]|uniref:Uncharacterized protein n=1 Tax=Rhodocollybia butyracea TaxID=206335 RepID=A0A9P5UEA9_9AGAR|nr:hypothetical protein BDP27DRAFT_1313808 [Rhodocollybia butyracea]